MATYLDLVRDVASRSGTTRSVNMPGTVVGADGRIGKFADLVNSAWRDIQIKRQDWRWMAAGFDAAVMAGTADVRGGLDLGIERFGRFDPNRNPREASRFSLAPVGATDWGRLRFMPFEEFSDRWRFGAVEAGRPQWFTVTPAGDLAFHPAPDAPCLLRGRYVRSVQRLALDADVPGMPEAYHGLIVSLALVKLASHDESPQQRAEWQAEANEQMAALVLDQTPEITGPGPLA